MGFRFRRSLGLIPGVRLNLGKKSASLSFGTRGFHYTVGTQGKRVTVGIPGTGLFWTQKIISPPSPPPPQIPQTQTPQPPAPQQNSFPVASRIAQPLPMPAPRTLGGGLQSINASQRRPFVPMWVVYTALSIIAIAGLCAAAAMVSGRIAIPAVKSQTGQQASVASSTFVPRSTIKNEEES
jgi:hypothetical protein